MLAKDAYRFSNPRIRHRLDQIAGGRLPEAAGPGPPVLRRARADGRSYPAPPACSLPGCSTCPEPVPPSQTRKADTFAAVAAELQGP